MPRTRIYADFNKRDEQGRLVLACRGTIEDLEKAQISLSKGLRLTFYMDDTDEHGNPADLEVDGIVDFDDRTQRWVGSYDPKDYRHRTKE